MYQETQAWAAELEQRVAERTQTLELINEALWESEERYRSLFDGVPPWASTAPRRMGGSSTANQALVEMSGYPDRGRPTHMLASPVAGAAGARGWASELGGMKD